MIAATKMRRQLVIWRLRRRARFCARKIDEGLSELDSDFIFLPEVMPTIGAERAEMQSIFARLRRVDPEFTRYGQP